MIDQDELSISELRNKRSAVADLPGGPEEEIEENFAGQSNGESFTRRGSTVLKTRPVSRAPQIYSEPEAEEDEPMRLPFDPTRAIDALRRYWWLWLLTGAALASLAVIYCLWSRKTTGSMQLIRRDVPILFRATDAGEAFKPQQFTDSTLATLIRSPELFRNVSEKSGTKIPGWKLSQSLFASSDRDTEILTLTYMGKEKPWVATNLLNIFAQEIVRFTQEMQIREGNEMADFMGKKLSAVEANLAQVTAELKQVPTEAKFADIDKQADSYLAQLSDLDVKYELARIDLEANNPYAEKLQAAREKLATLLIRYTDQHPLVKDQQLEIEQLEKQAATATNLLAKASASSPGTNSVAMLSNPAGRALARQLEQIKMLRENVQKKLATLSTEKNLTYAMTKSRYQSLETMRAMLVGRQREAQMYAQNALGYYQIFRPATLDRVSSRVNWHKGIVLIFAAGVLGMVLMAGFIVVGEYLDDRIKTAADLGRITELPVLATLGDLESMTPEEQKAWAFRTWTIIKGKISETQTHALVCGLISAEHGEGRSTWTKLLAQTAFQRGLRVLVAATRPSSEPPLHPHEKVEKPASGEPSTAVAQNVFAFPFQATRQLNDPKSHAIVNIPLPGWVWNLERRQQWQEALAEWERLENLVFLVELPPASEPEAILLAENVPQLIWLAESGKTTRLETRRHLETLRHAGCNLVGTVLNREPASFARKYFSRLFGMAALVLFTGLASVAGAAETNAPAQSGQTNFLAAPSTSPRAQWQQRLTLGPGDILTFSFYGETNWTKNDVIIGMDGRVSYLQAHDVVATGLTVDELRDKLNSELSKYIRTPRVMITPVSYHSKKYYVLGKVNAKGVYVLDRPLTIVEAVSRARGLETALAERNTIDMADLQRSFLVRRGERVPVDFEKLFHEGDFTQNQSLEPDDFLYFAPATLKEIYVVGEVRSPGVMPWTEHSSVVRVISERGGFGEFAFKHRVLVIRGSLTKPQVFTVNSWAILDAREADFKLQPRDIVYVSRRPFIRGEQLLDVAITSFLQSAVTAWSGAYIGPIFTKPFVPGL